MHSNVDPKEIIKWVLTTSRFVILISCFALVNVFSFKLMRLAINSHKEQDNTKEIVSTALKMISVLAILSIELIFNVLNNLIKILIN